MLFNSVKIGPSENGIGCAFSKSEPLSSSKGHNKKPETTTLSELIEALKIKMHYCILNF